MENRFQGLASDLERETGFYSTTIHMIDNSNYKEIISLGHSAIPLILKRLDIRNSIIWFVALKELTNANPVKREDAGNVQKMREAWLQWGRDNGLI